MATGSELPHALAAAETLGSGVRVVSMPCFERFERQSAAYKADILPASCEARIAIEAGVSSTWGQYLGFKGKALCIDRFGLSAPGGTVMKQLGMCSEKIVEAAGELIAHSSE